MLVAHLEKERLSVKTGAANALFYCYASISMSALTLQVLIDEGSLHREETGTMCLLTRAVFCLIFFLPQSSVANVLD